MRENNNIKVIRMKEDKMGTLLECLRYAGILYNVNSEIVEKRNGEIVTYYTFEILPPKNTHPPTWREMNTRRMRSFNVLAE